MEKQQREFLLRQQLAAVRKELGELDGRPGPPRRRTTAPASRPPTCPSTSATAALREVGKLERTSEQSPEVSWIRTWLDTVLELPWNVRTEDAYDIAGARAVLDADHAGLDDVKERIIEYLAVRKRRAERGSASSAAGAAVPCSPSSARPASARPRSASPSPGPWAATSSASPSAASATRRRSAATGAPTSARSPAASSAPSRRPAR